MSISALEALRVTELLDKDDRVADLTKFQPIVLQKKLDYYRETRIRSVSKDAKDSISSATDLAVVVSSGSARNDVESLLPSCFIYNRLYANDLLIKLAQPKTEFTDAYSHLAGVNSSSGLDVASLTRALEYFQRLSPLIRIGALTVLPVEELVSPAPTPDEGLPVFYSEDWLRSEVPEHIHDFVHEHAIISEVEPAPNRGGLFILGNILAE